MAMCPSPPFLRGVLTQARCVSAESQDAAMSWQLIASKAARASLNAMISVGHWRLLKVYVHAVERE